MEWWLAALLVLNIIISAITLYKLSDEEEEIPDMVADSVIILDAISRVEEDTKSLRQLVAEAENAANLRLEVLRESMAKLEKKPPARRPAAKK